MFPRIFLAALAALAVMPVQAQTIISVTGPNAFYATTGVYTSWTQTGSFSGVTIQAYLYSGGGTATGTAYLVTQVGPGATSAQQIGAAAPISVTSETPVATTLFTNLTLGPGTYYLVISRTTDLRWSMNTTAQSGIVTAAGVTSNPIAFAAPVAGYPPASTWVMKSGTSAFFSAAGGTVTTSVPVLSPAAMLAMALMLLTSGLLLMRKYRLQ